MTVRRIIVVATSAKSSLCGVWCVVVQTARQHAATLRNHSCQFDTHITLHAPSVRTVHKYACELSTAHKCALDDFRQCRQCAIQPRTDLCVQLQFCGTPSTRSNTISTSDVWLTVHRNSVWIRKTNWMSIFVFFISLLIVAQHVSGNHVPIIRS